MINAEEHKQLLAQIKELEKDSVNYFDVEKEFFLITSDNLASVQTKFYGYSIQRTGIYEEENLTPEAVANLDGRGCYVYVEVKDGKITIKQDLNGCWGIYLFRHGDYFALSNSFFRLLDYVKFRYPLTPNRDFISYLPISGYACQAYSETAVNEICTIDRNSTLTINIAKKTLKIEIIDYKEHSVFLDSEEGMAILDYWFETWCIILRGIAHHTKFIQADLSGGFDTRTCLAILLNSGIDLNKVKIYSKQGKLHTMSEDYEIATQIAKHYSFKLNQPLPTTKYLNYTFSDTFNINSYVRQTFSSVIGFTFNKKLDKTYHLNGGGGEGIRDTFGDSRIEFMEKKLNEYLPFSKNLSNEIRHYIEKIFESAFNSIQDKCGFKDNNHRDITLYLPRETLCVYHNGKDTTQSYFGRTVKLSPIYDPQLYTLHLYTKKCPDPKLLMATIYTRYEPNLLKFPFNNKRSIAPETIEYAKKINERFPRQAKHVANITNRGGNFHLQPRDMQVEKILASGRNNKHTPSVLPEKCLKAMFDSSRTYGLFTSYFDEELYRYASSYYDTHIYGRSRPLYSIVGVTRVLEDVEISQRNHRPYRDMQRFLEQDFCKINHEDSKIVSNFSRYFTARIDLKLMSTAGDFQILSTSDDKAKLEKPNWFQKDGVGYVIQSYVGELEILAKSTVDGEISMLLRGIDIRLPEDKTKLIPYWVDYTSLTVNGKTIFDTLTPAWHDKFYTYKMDVKAGEEIKIQVEWLPHRSDT